MYIYIYIYVYMYMNMNMSVCLYVCMYACLYACMYLCMYVCMYVCMHVCVYICMHVCAYVCVYVRMYVCMYVCMYLFGQWHKRRATAADEAQNKNDKKGTTRLPRSETPLTQHQTARPGRCFPGSKPRGISEHTTVDRVKSSAKPPKARRPAALGSGAGRSTTLLVDADRPLGSINSATGTECDQASSP